MAEMERTYRVSVDGAPAVVMTAEELDRALAGMGSEQSTSVVIDPEPEEAGP